MSTDEFFSDADSGRPLTGWGVLGILIVGFGVMFAVNGLMAYYAVSTFRGETEASPYAHGLAYQKDIEAAKAQAALGWDVSAHVARDAEGAAAVEIRMRDAAAAPLQGLAVTSRLVSPADVKLDAALALAETAPGVYSGRTRASPGQWDLEIEAGRDGTRLFRSTNRLTLR